MKFLAAMFLTLALAACASMGAPTDSPQMTQLKQIETACAVGTVALQGLTIASEHDKLTDANRAQIAKAIPVFKDVCVGPTPPTMDALKMKAFMAAVDLFSSLAR